MKIELGCHTYKDFLTTDHSQERAHKGCLNKIVFAGPRGSTLQRIYLIYMQLWIHDGDSPDKSQTVEHNRYLSFVRLSEKWDKPVSGWVSVSKEGVPCHCLITLQRIVIATLKSHAINVLILRCSLYMCESEVKRGNETVGEKTWLLQYTRQSISLPLKWNYSRNWGHGCKTAGTPASNSHAAHAAIPSLSWVCHDWIVIKQDILVEVVQQAPDCLSHW